MSNRTKFLSSTVGTKILLAFTGLALFLFLVLHLIGNAMAFLGPEWLNGYSHHLISNPLIYVAELGLAAIFVIHVWKAVTNWAFNRTARPTHYVNKNWAGHTSRKTVASSTMIYTGVATFAFIIWHLKTFKFGAWYTVTGNPEMRDLYRLLIEVFSSPVYVVLYVVSMILILFHLRHGLSSSMQSLGINHPRYEPWILRIGYALALIIGLGFASIPVWAYFVGSRS